MLWAIGKRNLEYRMDVFWRYTSDSPKVLPDTEQSRRLVAMGCRPSPVVMDDAVDSLGAMRRQLVAHRVGDRRRPALEPGSEAVAEEVWCARNCDRVTISFAVHPRRTRWKFDDKIINFRLPDTW